MEYLLKSSGIITLFFVVFKLFLALDTFFQAIRIYFLAGIICAVAIPFINITTYVETSATPILVFSSSAQNLLNLPMTTEVNWNYWLAIIYIIGAALSGIYLLFQFTNLYRILYKQPYKKIDNHKIIESDLNVSPFSFFNYIVYNPVQFSESERQQLLNHEQTHAKQWHSFDTVLIQLFLCFQWFNPFLWFYKNALIQNLEYLADSRAKNIDTPKNYSYLLLKTAMPKYQLALVNNFYKSPLKNRIMMLHKTNSRRINQLKFALILPFLIGFIFTLNTKVVAQNSQTNEVVDDITNFSIQLDKEVSNENLKFIKEKFKTFGYTIKINKIKRNLRNELTSIKITANKDKANTQYAVSGTTPINPFKIEYFSKNDEVKIGTADPINNNKKGYSYSITEKFESDSILDKNQINQIFYTQKGDSIVKIKFGKNSNNIFISNNNSGLKTVLNASDKNQIWKDRNDIITKIIEVKTDRNGHNKKIIVKDVGIGREITIDSVKKKDMLFKGMSSDNVKNTLLIIVDGKEMKGSKLDMINPQIIESINVLKGAKAIDKYGQKAKNGVVEITTRSHKKD